jgi:hypothetical protein
MRLSPTTSTISMTSESPFSSYLNTNHVPSALEADGIAALIADRAEAASEIHARLERLAKEAQVWQGQLDQHIHYIEEHQAIISAFRRLPDSALVRIFLASRGGRVGRLEPAVAISHVCHQWRRLVLGTPRMWTTVGVPLSGYTPAAMSKSEEIDEATLDRVSAYIERSGELRLSVWIGVGIFCPEGLEDRRDLHEGLMKILVPTIHRWKSLDLNVPDDSPFACLLELPGTTFTTLKSLAIDFQSARRRLKHDAPYMEPALIEAPPVDLAIGVWSAESLTTLRLRGIGKPIAEMNAVLPVHWSTLTFLSLGSSTRFDMQQHHIIPILAECTNLLSCSLTLDRDSDVSDGAQQRTESPTTEATLPSLYALELLGSEVAIRGLASKLTLPSLKSLTTLFNMAPDPTPDGKCALIEWVDRYGDQLLSISFDYVTLIQSNLTHCLSRLPNLVDLRMTGKKRLSTFGLFPRRRGIVGLASALIDDDVLGSLTPRDGQSEGDTDDKSICFCPKLERLECHMGFTERSEKAFVRFILARYGDGTKEVLPGGVRRIRAVVLSFNYEKPDYEGSRDIQDEVNRAIDAGDMAIYVEYNTPLTVEASESVYQVMMGMRK